jgi:hypothetical protein
MSERSAVGNQTYVKRRAVLYHEGGTLVLLNLMVFVLICCVIGVAIWVAGLERVYSVPGIHNSQVLDVKWGAHGP